MGVVVASRNTIFISASEYGTLDENVLFGFFLRRLISLSTISLSLMLSRTRKQYVKVRSLTLLDDFRTRESAKFSRLRKGKSES